MDRLPQHLKIFASYIATLATFCYASPVFAATTPANTIDSNALNDPFYFLFLLLLLTLLPFIVVMATSFTKIVVVLSIARQAIGTAQTPPNIVIMSLAILLTAFSMYPVGVQIYLAIDQTKLTGKMDSPFVLEIVRAAKEPMRTYLSTHAHEEDKQLFFSLLEKKSLSDGETVTMNDFIILAPAFLISELSLAFQIGFLIYLPFLVIDMTVANLLMALGMQMLSPTTISLPFKILLFVLVDGFRLLSEGLAKV